MAIEIKNRGNKKAELYLYEEIGSGWMGGISAKEVADALKAAGNLDEIKVRINSPGGSVFDGLTIYNTLVKNSAKVIVEVDGLAASIASIIAMAGDEIGMASNSMMMIHDPWTMAAGSADELRQQADLLDKVRGQLLSTYQKQTGGEPSVISDMMTAETWMTADEALASGFIHKVTDEVKMAAHFDLSKFRNTPQALQTTNIKPKLTNNGSTVINDRLKLMTTKLNKMGVK